LTYIEWFFLVIQIKEFQKPKPKPFIILVVLHRNV